MTLNELRDNAIAGYAKTLRELLIREAVHVRALEETRGQIVLTREILNKLQENQK